MSGDHEDLYPPFQRGSATSEKAAEEILSIRPTILARVLAFYRSQGRVGATNDELSFALGIPIQTICARKRELEIKGLIWPADKQRKTRSGRQAEVYIAKEFAKEDYQCPIF